MYAYYFQLGLRSLRRNPLLTALMVMAIGFGVAASMITYSVFRATANNPIPQKSDQLYAVQIANWKPEDLENGEPPSALTYTDAMALMQAHKAKRQTALYPVAPSIIPADASRLPIEENSYALYGDAFAMFDIPFIYGGPWGQAQDDARAAVAVIGKKLNDKLFNGANSVGRTLRLKDTDVRIIGVLAPWRPSPQFYDVTGGRFSNGKTAGFYAHPEDVFMPFESSLEVNAGGFNVFTCWRMPENPQDLTHSPCVWVALWVELGDATKVAKYTRFVADYAAQQKALGRFVHADNTAMPSLMQWLDINQVVPSDVRLQTWLAFAFLAICLFNTIGLLLAKFLRRAGEIGVRRALGASRAAVFAQCLVEAGLIGLLGGLGGLLLTMLGLWLIRRQPVEYADLVHLDASMFLVTFALAITASLLAGVLPALRASRMAPSLQLKTL